MNLSTSFRELPPSVEMSLIWLKHMYSVLCSLTCRSLLFYIQLCINLLYMYTKHEYKVEMFVKVLMEFGYVVYVVYKSVIAVVLTTCLEHRLIRSKKTASSWLRKEAEGTPQKQLPTPSTLMTYRFWQMYLPKPKT